MRSGSGLDLSIVIVNYNTRELLRGCLSSIQASEGSFTHEVLVVDNCSQDGSPQMVQGEFPWVKLLENAENRGYAAANNLALRESQGRYVLLLNADTILPSDALQGMLAFMEAHPEAGAAGPKLVRQDGSLDLACRRSFPTPAVSFYRMLGLSKLFPSSPRFARYNLTYLSPDGVYEVDSVVGAFMMVRREAMEEVGLLDESFFLYGEDLDWAYRLKGAGWKVYYNPDVVVLHYKGEATRQNRLKARYEFYRAMYLFHQKHFAHSTPLWLHILVVSGILSFGGLSLLAELRPTWILGRR
jgi:GT2 family glycosyltransferase